MGKRQKHFDEIKELKARFRTLSTDEIRQRLSLHRIIMKPGATALREILEEREREDGGRPETDSNSN